MYDFVEKADTQISLPGVCKVPEGDAGCLLVNSKIQPRYTLNSHKKPRTVAGGIVIGF